MCEIIQLPKIRKFIATIQTTNSYEIEIDENLDQDIINYFEEHYFGLDADKVSSIAEKILYLSHNYFGSCLDGIGSTFDKQKGIERAKGIKISSLEDSEDVNFKIIEQKETDEE
jgi:hypothetical protein